MAWHYVEDYEDLTGEKRETDAPADPVKASVKAKVVAPPKKSAVGKADVQVETA